jgi:hypothetical protein
MTFGITTAPRYSIPSATERQNVRQTAFSRDYREETVPLFSLSLGEDPGRKQSTCESEQKYPMKGWRLEAIGMDGDRTLLRYGVSRDAGKRRVHDPFWIWVSKKDDQEYHVTGYEQWY